MLLGEWVNEVYCIFTLLDDDDNNKQSEYCNISMYSLFLCALSDWTLETAAVEFNGMEFKVNFMKTLLADKMSTMGLFL